MPCVGNARESDYTKRIETKNPKVSLGLAMDAKDILGLPKTPLPITQEKKSQPKKDSQRKPDGISREVCICMHVYDSLFCPFNQVNFCCNFVEFQVYALTGGLAPLMPSIDTTQLKRRPPSDEKVCHVGSMFQFFFFQFF